MTTETETFYHIRFDHFSTIYAPIVIPKNTILFRGYNENYPPVSDRPSYYSHDISVAEAYGNRRSVFVTTKEIKLYDLRFIRCMLNDMIDRRKGGGVEVTNAIYTLSLSYGLCSLNKQIELVKHRYKNGVFAENISSLENYKPLLGNPCELKGVRIAETTNDTESIGLLKSQFGEISDGYIAPILESPFHIEKGKKMSAELVLYNAQAAGIKLLDVDLMENKPLLNIHIDMVIAGLLRFQMINVQTMFADLWLMKGGGQPIPVYDPRNQHFDEMDTNSYVKLNNRCDRIMRRLTGVKKLQVDAFEERPTCKIIPWTHET